jgi:hypothetical protein
MLRCSKMGTEAAIDVTVSKMEDGPYAHVPWTLKVVRVWEYCASGGKILLVRKLVSNRCRGLTGNTFNVGVLRAITLGS